MLTCGALRLGSLLLQKKQTAAAYMASAGKVGSEEKWAHAAMEYLHERRHCNDGRKRQHDVDGERRLSLAFDRYCAANDRAFSARLLRLSQRMTEALEALSLPEMPPALLEEATLLAADQPPGSLRRPSLTPPLPGYEPGFGLDVPQLRAQHAEYPPVRRPSDAAEFGAGADAAFPFVEAYRVADLAAQCQRELDERHGELREAAPLTGVEGEAWEAYVALQRKALARQELICELCEDAEMRARYDADAEFREKEWARRGMLPLRVEEAVTREAPRHYAQEPAYQSFRKH